MAGASAACRAAPGGLSSALGRAQLSEPKAIRPRPVRNWADREETTGASESSTNPTTTSGNAARGGVDAAGLEAGLAELRRLFASECSLGTSAPGFGVSPPVRSGAANGLVHDSLWRQEAHASACKASLRALQEKAGPRCLSSCAGDYRLLLTSPDQGLLAGALEGEDGGDMELAPSASWRSMTSSRASPGLGGWQPAHCFSPEPSEAGLFSY